MALKVVVDFDLCEANARCMEVCPEVFRVDDDDVLHILIERPPASMRAKLEEARASAAPGHHDRRRIDRRVRASQFGDAPATQRRAARRRAPPDRA